MDATKNAAAIKNAAATKNATSLVKFSYKGNRYSIFTTKRHKIMTYQVFLKYVKSLFNFHTLELKCLEVSDEHGNIFDEESFGNYMILFPKPRQVFYLKLNFAKRLHKVKEKSVLLEDLFNANCALKENQNKLSADDEIKFAVPK